MPEGGVGALPNTDSSVSERPLKLIAYPPNGTLFGDLALPLALAFAIALSSSGSWWKVSVALCSLRAGPQRWSWRRPFPWTFLPPGNTDQPAARFRRASADFRPAARAAARFSGEVTRHRRQT